MNRPKISDPSVIAAAAKLLAPKVMKWGEDTHQFLDAEETELLLARALRWHDDGYEIAVELSRASYSPDAALVAILDEASWLLHVAADAVHMARLKTQPEGTK